MTQLEIKKLHPNATMPTRATEGAAGYDLCACLDAPLCVTPGTTVKVPTGLSIALPSAQYGAFIFGRSGLCVKHGLAPANAVGVIDSDYRGEILVALYNHSQEAYTITPGERVAQMVILPVCLPQLCLVDQLDETSRGDGGFGSTGRV